VEYNLRFINSIKENHYMFDLPAFVELKLKEAGVKDIKNIGKKKAEITISKIRA
jgi:copper oxidase (laccase) domain-containing protein